MIPLGMLLILGLFMLSIMINPELEISLWPYFDTWAFAFVGLGVLGYVIFSGPMRFLRGLKGLIMLPDRIAYTIDAGLAFPKSGKPEIAEYYRRLSRFTSAWGLLGMIIGAVWGLSDMNPDHVGVGIAFCLFSFLYSTALSLFFFWPIAARFSPRDLPPENESWKWRHFPIMACLVGIGAYFAVRSMMSLIIFSMAAYDAETTIAGTDWASFVYMAFFTLNPADIYPEPYPFIIFYYLDLPTFVVLAGGLGIVRLSAGPLRSRFEWVPISITLGLFWTVQGFVMMLGDMNPETYASGCLVALFGIFYGFFVAVLFLIGSKRLAGLIALSFLLLSIISCADPGWFTYDFLEEYLAFSLYLLINGTLAGLIIYFAYHGIRKRLQRLTAPPQPQPLGPEEEKARQALDNAIKEEKNR